jgi:hypothetical protein
MPREKLNVVYFVLSSKAIIQYLELSSFRVLHSDSYIIIT